MKTKSEIIKCECGGIFEVIEFRLGNGISEYLKCERCGKQVYAKMLLHIAENKIRKAESELDLIKVITEEQIFKVIFNFPISEKWAVPLSKAILSLYKGGEV